VKYQYRKGGVNLPFFLNEFDFKGQDVPSCQEKE